MIESVEDLFALLHDISLMELSPLFVLQPPPTTSPTRHRESGCVECKLALKFTKDRSYCAKYINTRWPWLTELPWYCLDNTIHPICLPSRSTHLLRPLDIGLFGPLQRGFSTELDGWHRRGWFWFGFYSFIFIVLYRSPRLMTALSGHKIDKRKS